MHQVFFGIGGNIGNKSGNLEKARLLIEKEIGEISRQSSIYETPPWGFDSDENFWNQVLLVKTELEPEVLLSMIGKIDEFFGRTRAAEKYTSREMDVDILYYDDLEYFSDNLIIPHPRISQRLFVLMPLSEIAPRFLHPVLKMTNRQLLEQCPDTSTIIKIDL